MASRARSEASSESTSRGACGLAPESLKYSVAVNALTKARLSGVRSRSTTARGTCFTSRLTA